jgi:transcriptional regulator with XRE-family HTH domain
MTPVLARGYRARRSFLLAKMDEAGLTTAALADKLALDTTYVSRIVNGHRTPSLEVAMALAVVLGVKLDDLAEILVPAA